MEGTIAHVIVQDELMYCCFQFIESDRRIKYPIGGVRSGRLVVQYRVVLGTPATPPFIGADITLIPENNGNTNVHSMIAGNQALVGLGNPDGARGGLVIFFLFRGPKFFLLYR